mmetsp:Transcript_26011/g.47531  ORF Transcript_26011/g.47531 Transcript_26011/m.47531 type:complete len:801 (+) Transcript_26011:67-2469(+)
MVKFNMVKAREMKKNLCSSYSSASSTTSSPRETEFHEKPDSVLHDLSLPYVQMAQLNMAPVIDAKLLLTKTPLPKASSAFTSVHIVAMQAVMSQAAGLQKSMEALGKVACSYSYPQLEKEDVVGEYNAIFKVTSELILNGADRSSLLVFVGSTGDSSELAIASLIGMLPFRGVQVAFVSPCCQYVNPLEGTLCSPSGVFEYTASQAERMARSPLAAVFGPLHDCTFRQPLGEWAPLRVQPLQGLEKPAPFKIGALDLPMVTYEGKYADGLDRLASVLVGHFGESIFPVVACGETVDALGYGSDILAALERQGYHGFYFAHKSGESYKRPDAYGKPELLHAIANAKARARTVVVLTVGGGVNGNTMGVIAAMTGAALVEVPTTLMHYNDATTSAKKAFSLVVNGQILSKNILGTFYLPKLVFCISETFLTLSSSSIHAAVGEATKTMSMLGKASSRAGQKDFYNILGGVEFARDFTRIIQRVDGFEHLIEFLAETRRLKDVAIAAGEAVMHARTSGLPAESQLPLLQQRSQALEALRAHFHEQLPEANREKIMGFLTVINEEIIAAKAMFLAYSDPFEKYRALLFEYAHTLGHGVEAFMNGLYRRAEEAGIDCEEAFRLHGQCVGMAVVWAGEMSKDLGHLRGDGYRAHQSLVYLFNRFGGFDFGPLRSLCDRLGVSCDEFCEGVLKVVRRDNKRGYCKCAEGSSVDQLVSQRPGCLLRSSDPSAELRYLVEVSEESQRTVLQRAFEGAYDNVLTFEREALEFIPRNRFTADGRSAKTAAQALDGLIQSLYEDLPTSTDSE